jgi:hypothetical protein
MPAPQRQLDSIMSGSGETAKARPKDARPILLPDATNHGLVQPCLKNHPPYRGGTASKAVAWNAPGI